MQLTIIRPKSVHGSMEIDGYYPNNDKCVAQKNSLNRSVRISAEMATHYFLAQ